MSMLRCRRNTDLFNYLCEGGNAGRFDQKILNLSIDVLHDGKIQYYPPGDPHLAILPAHATTQIHILYCFIQYIKYLYGILDQQLDIRMFRRIQYDDFRTNLNLYTPGQPIYEDSGYNLNEIQCNIYT